MYIALTSFTTKDYEVRRKQILEDDFTNQDEINEFLEIGYIEVYVPSQEVDTSDATSEADDIVTGKTAYAKGEKLVGTFTGIVPTGTKSITENGTVDVSGFASAEVNVSGGSSEYNGKFVTTPISAEYSNGYRYVQEVPALDLGYFGSTGSMFNNWQSLQKVALFDTSNITDMHNMFSNCASLQDVPIYNTSKVTNMQSIFSGCGNLTNDSLNNIMQMCINSKVTGSSNKRLLYIGLTSAQATICQGLSNYAAFTAAGWSTGY